MKNACIFAALALASVSSMAQDASANRSKDWLLLGKTTAGDSVFLKVSSVTGSTGRWSFWTKTEMVKPRPTEHGRAQASTMSRYHVLCEERTMSHQVFVSYDKQGGVIFSDDIPTPHRAAIPDSVGESLLDFVCRFAEGR